ncbi:uncharacterized protein N7484_003519 [Penicillium longicatenatum]|uniref:uncharacterized protein n=1 Tax=Penicillium longicatenatum TaxID=1561947 RepID=UPI002547C9B3|nr:uncharacterized protein N7484_003519 [Penicillium longicatenatum]KAJ5649796.1 hypothetical protein N7484_003519 [Penicillium longicatenatum]
MTSKVIAITGGASGIGAATARLIAERGASAICVGDLSSHLFDDLKESIQEINPSTRVHCTVLDVTQSVEVEKWIQEIVDLFGDIHGAANIAGIAQGEGIRKSQPNILHETDEEWAKIFRTNLDGVFYSTRAQVRAMKTLEKADRSIVNVGSIAGMFHVPDVYAYGTSKGACAYFTKCVAKDVIDFGVRVNNVSPGITRTPLLPQFNPSAKSIDEIERMYKKDGFMLLQPEDIARTIAWLLSDDSKPVYGADLNVGAPPP